MWEDDNFIAILDVNPNMEGMTLVIPKEHQESYVFDLEDEKISAAMKASKKVAKILEKGLGVQRVTMVTEGLGVNHLHVKLYPIHGLEQRFEETWAKEKIYFDKYEGYISTQLGPAKSLEELDFVLKKINKNI